MVVVALLAVLTAGAGAAFQPWKLFTDVEVREADPFVGALPRPASPVRPAVPAVLAEGSFRSIAHPTTGRARLGAAADGSTRLFLDELDTDNGPTLRLYLSRTPADGDASGHGIDPLDLGDLKGNLGDQDYAVPAGTDLGPYRSVVIWCERFRVAFGVAPLDAPAVG